jgi:hypothetical protein
VSTITDIMQLTKSHGRWHLCVFGKERGMEAEGAMLPSTWLLHLGALLLACPIIRHGWFTTNTCLLTIGSPAGRRHHQLVLLHPRSRDPPG